MMSYKIKKNLAYYVMVAVTLLVGLLLAIPVTRRGLVGIFGWAVIAYDLAIGVLGILLLCGKKIAVKKWKVALYIALFLFAVCTLHALLTKDYFPGGIYGSKEYMFAVPFALAMESPFSGTAGGVLAAILIRPIMLVTNSYVVTISIYFVVTALLGLVALMPVFLSIKDFKFTKKKPAESVVTTNPIPKKTESAFAGGVREESPRSEDLKAMSQTSRSSAESILFGGSHIYTGEPERSPSEGKVPLDKRNLFRGVGGEEAYQSNVARDSAEKLFGGSANRSNEDINSKLRLLGKGNDKSFEERLTNKVTMKPSPYSGGAYEAQNVSSYSTVKTSNAQPPLHSEAKPISQLSHEEKLEYIKHGGSISEYVSPFEIMDETKNTGNGNQTPNYGIPNTDTHTDDLHIDFSETLRESPLFARNASPEKPPLPVPSPDAFAQPVNVQQGNLPQNLQSQNQGRQSYAASAQSSRPAYVGHPTQPSYSQQIPVPSTLSSGNGYGPQNPGQSMGLASAFPPQPSTQYNDFPPQSGEPREEYTKIHKEEYMNLDQNLPDIQDDIPFEKKMMNYRYTTPSLEMLRQRSGGLGSAVPNYNLMKERIETALLEYGFPATVVSGVRGPTFTLFEIQLGAGVDATKLNSKKSNIQMRLQVPNLRLIIPIKGKDAIGFEIANEQRDTVGLRSIISTSDFASKQGGVYVGFGKGIDDRPFCDDISKMPHLMIAGATGGGKSVFMHNIIMSIIYKYSPEDVRLLMIDPKQVELTMYRGIPHMLVGETAKRPDHSINTLAWLSDEVNRRFEFLGKHGCNSIESYNEHVRDKRTDPKMFRIVLVVDEVAELMLNSGSEVEKYIQSIAQLGRACGVHIILATQRPTVKVITGNIKCNFLCRVAFSVKTATDSIAILDKGGAEELLGSGDMIYSDKIGEMHRLQSAFVDLNDEVEPVCDFIREHNQCIFDAKAVSAIFAEPAPKVEDRRIMESSCADKAVRQAEERAVKQAEKEADDEELIKNVMRTFLINNKASVSMAQVKHGIGFIRAKRIVGEIYNRGYIDAEEAGSKSRKVLMTPEQFNEIYGENLVIGNVNTDCDD